MRMCLLCLFWLAFMLAAAPDAAAEETGKRIALVIGNGQYEAAGTLPNAVNDARQFGAFLSARGFDADVVIDADRRHLAEAMSRFVGKINTDDVALFYFAGHGMQLRGENYLVGTDARLASEFDVAAETLALTDVIAAVEKKSKIALFFLDACRNNPLANRLNQEVEGATRSIATRGLAPVETESAGTMVAFAAAPGQVASDGSGKNSPFTKALIGHLAGPGLEIGTAFKRVIRDVRKATDGKQSPQILSSLALEFYFDPSLPKEEQKPEQSPAASPAIDLTTIEIEADFRKALRINTPRFWKLFLAKYRTGEQASMARQFLTQMQPSSDAVSLTPEKTENRLLQTNDTRRKIQIALANRGFDPGSADGAFGLKTRRALSDYQKSVGVTPTGYVGDMTAKKLGLNVAAEQDADGVYSSATARLYKPEDFTGLETDLRVLKAVACLPSFPKLYGSFGGHLYLFVKDSTATHYFAARTAKNCGGYLASITSAAENDFIGSLMNGDQTLFATYYDPKNNSTSKMGAWIGLVQVQGAAEPKSGWTWENAEPLAYTKWHSGKPNEHKSGDDFGMFYTDVSGRRDVQSINVDTWDDMGPGDRTGSFVVEIE